MRYLILMLFLLMQSAIADGLDAPKGEVLLTISGNITHTNSEQGAEFDRDMLESLGVTSFTTSSPWTDIPTLFSGVRFDILLKAVGAKSDSVRATAIDSYWYDIKGVDFEKYPVVLAYQRDGKAMTARNLGPLWLMFPFDDHPELLTHANKASCVWQLNALIVQ